MPGLKTQKLYFDGGSRDPIIDSEPAPEGHVRIELVDGKTVFHDPAYLPMNRKGLEK